MKYEKKRPKRTAERGRTRELNKMKMKNFTHTSKAKNIGITFSDVKIKERGGMNFIHFVIYYIVWVDFHVPNCVLKIISYDPNSIRKIVVNAGTSNVAS